MTETDSGPLSIADAVRALSQDPRVAKPDTRVSDTRAADNREPDDEEDRAQTPEDDELASRLAEEESDTPEATDEGPPDEPEEPEYRAGRFAADDAKVRLDDGKVITIAELRKGTLLQSDYSRKTQAVAEERKVLEQWKAQVAADEQQLAQQREVVAGLWQELLPAPPDPAMLDPNSGSFDVVTYMAQKEQYERKAVKAQRLIADHQAMLARQAYEVDQSQAQIRNYEAERLFERMPELRNPQAYQQFWSEAVETVADYGFSPEELDAVNDHRTYLVLKEVMAFRKLKQNVASAKTKVSGKPAVMSGSSRRSSDVVTTQRTKAALAQLNQTGSMQDGIRAMIALDKAKAK